MHGELSGKQITSHHLVLCVAAELGTGFCETLGAQHCHVCSLGSCLFELGLERRARIHQMKSGKEIRKGTQLKRSDLKVHTEEVKV
jgi:hypothetical protein